MLHRLFFLFTESPSAEVKRYEFVPALKKMVKNKNYLIIFVAGLFGIGGANSFLIYF